MISRTKKIFFAEFSKILISELSTRKERFREKRISRISNCIEKKYQHAMYSKNDFYAAILIKKNTSLAKNAFLMLFSGRK